jgi:glycosyltransferase involved in cell wall biosynthesis
MPDILFVCSALQTGGAERQWSILIPGLANRGFRVRLLTLAARGRFFDEIQATGVSCESADLKSRWDLRGINRALELAKPAPDIVMTHETNAQVLGHFIASRAKAAHVTVDHTPPGLPRKLHRRLLVRLVAKRVDYTIAVSQSQLPELAAIGFDRQRLRVIYNGLPPLRPTKSREQARASLGIKSGDFIAVVIAALRSQKRVPVFIEAVAAAHRADDRIKGLVAGGGSALDALRALAADRGSSVRLLGERADVADLIVASDVVCLTSWTEATPIALIEAMALGRPVVAAAVGGVNEVVVDGETGIVVRAPDPRQFASALHALAADSSRARAFGQAGMARYERLFTAEKMLDDYAEVFHRLLHSRGKFEGRDFGPPKGAR